MKRNILVRYMILIAVLVIFAGAAWMLTNTQEAPKQDAVLAWHSGEEAPASVRLTSEKNAVFLQHRDGESAVPVPCADAETAGAASYMSRESAVSMPCVSGETAGARAECGQSPGLEADAGWICGCMMEGGPV